MHWPDFKFPPIHLWNFPKQKRDIMKEKIESPEYYKNMVKQPWDVMQEELTHEEFIGYLKGCIIKYSMREGKKEGTDDLLKAEHYREKLLEALIIKPHKQEKEEYNGTQDKQ